MIIHFEKNRHWYERQDWKEYFRIEVYNQYHENFGKQGNLIPRFYYPTNQLYYRDSTMYWIAPLVPFVKLYYWLDTKYYNLARYCKYKGWIKKEPGAMYRKLWFLDLFK